MALTQAVSRSAALGLALLFCAALSHAQSFPCPSQTSNSSNSNNLAGGYQNINPNQLTNSNILDLGLAVNASFTQFVEEDNNVTLCNDINQLVGEVEFGVLQACTQVVAGTNYGIRFLAQYTCLIDDEQALAQDALVLNTVVYVPLGANAEPQVQSVSIDTSVPVEEAVLPVQFIALSPGSAPDAPGSPDDNILAAAPTTSPSPPSTPYTLEGL
ncbi:hypothetical protein WJX73_010118 [Symbiochloris irregularis]|uniref:Uncharacterized protein n=1 Tax=Symbiochloris irregularis TaxID=706552 RepID=A0AAW1NU18_9CHLO